MLDVHPPHAPTHSWRDFFIHIATIVLGLLIAIGLEQSVEALHHRDQRNELTEHMRAEAERSLPVVRESLVRLQTQRTYVQSLQAALSSAKLSGTTLSAPGVAPPGGSAVFVSVSRSTWTSAQATGLVALLPSDQAGLYSRIDFNAAEAIHDEDEMYENLRLFLAECSRANFNYATPAFSTLTVAHRDDLLFQLSRVEAAIENYAIRLSLMEGADESVVAGVRSLQAMYPYQSAALARLTFNSRLGGFYGGQTGSTYKDLSTHPASSE
jgi:hypothetical protein